MKLWHIPIIVFTGLIIMSAGIDLNQLLNYAQQPVPPYISKDNTPPGNTLSDKGATLGRVLFYDTQLSVNNTIACASCHIQAFAFGDTAQLSKGLDGGFTGRHSMRLVNARFGNEIKFFWDERANSLENQTTRPIQDHVEMGFSGTNSYPNLDSLIRRMSGIDYYPRLFAFVYGDSLITEDRMQRALAQFIRSIQSFDSRFDAGRAQVVNVGSPFPNFTPEENQGKQIFLNPPQQGGMGCQGCHRAPEFDIDPNSLNNGVIAVANSPGNIDITNTRSPSLRDLFNPNGNLNGPLMHNGNFTDIMQVLNHYNQIPQNPNNTNLDPRVGGPNGMGQNLNKTPQELAAVLAFLRTLTGSDVYTNEKWSDPFDANGSLTVLPSPEVSTQQVSETFNISTYPNPVKEMLNIQVMEGTYVLKIYNLKGQLLKETDIFGNTEINLTSIENGILILLFEDKNTGRQAMKKIIKIDI